ncbi:Jjj1p [Lachancea thermotolerans CBS 6340]|uniref:KLTH0B08338p n=1 Tax=Lachancea thermotolerans (strain ATCC 56472 / CBS 6340 / NRRL Y-8284) TaxID=559295 RepID=C5DD51_LACTC|nr:KLTH0B08338p [Lachancea thermotolerans CBS 6340]CAR21712.1 KLTH0B08338p [Lachancea thermotolerans CBS 6340]
MKTCYYELLGVETTASDSDLKKAYRRKALQYHPDKNPDNVEEATTVFATIRSAYEVLADPQERAWYDSHKQQILSDDFGAENGDDYDEYEVDAAVSGVTTDDLLKFFNTGLYSRVDDTPAGFYQIAGKVFAKLASEEVRFGRMQGLPKFAKYQDDFFEADMGTQGYRKAFEKYSTQETLLFPPFGDSSAGFQYLRAFYRDWSSFNTVKTFSWKDEYMYSRNYDRRTKREIKKRNEKLRQQARSEYNKTVKRFVVFIKKFDKRMKEGAAKFEQEKRKKLQEDLRKQIEKDRLANSRDVGDPFKLQSWQTVDDLDWDEMEAYFDESKTADDAPEGSEDEVLVYECFICNKTFKSPNQLENHNNTKSHKKMLRQIQREMHKDNMVLGLDAVSDVDEFNSADEEFGSNAEDLQKMDELDMINAELERIQKELEEISDKGDDSLSPSDSEVPESATVGSKEGKSTLPDDQIDEEKHSFTVDDEVDSDFEISDGTKSPSASKQEEDVDELSKLLASLQGGAGEDTESDSWDNNKKPKKKQKGKNKATSSVQPSPPPTYQCGTCSDQFTTRNTLFKHIKKSNHAAPVKATKAKKSKR